MLHAKRIFCCVHTRAACTSGHRQSLPRLVSDEETAARARLRSVSLSAGDAERRELYVSQHLRPAAVQRRTAHLLWEPAGAAGRGGQQRLHLLPLHRQADLARRPPAGHTGHLAAADVEGWRVGGRGLPPPRQQRPGGQHRHHHGVQGVCCPPGPGADSGPMSAGDNTPADLSLLVLRVRLCQPPLPECEALHDPARPRLSPRHTAAQWKSNISYKTEIVN